ncbi:MAG: N-acetyltransferase [Deltaproteobacteria bacterium]|nr:MAG: N-acetyltransferase [Deltaproteobacteria bacterium]
MAWRGKQLVDGDGVARVLMHLRGERLRLRAAREEDCRLLWEWANDPEVRSVSFSSDPIPWVHHVQWFKSKLASAYCQILVAIDGNERPVGQVRFDINGKEAIISVSVDRKFRGKGLGTEMIRLATQQFFNNSDVDVIHAYIKSDNKASVKAFKKAGFEFIGKTDVKGHEALHFVLQRNGSQDENEQSY